MATREELENFIYYASGYFDIVNHDTRNSVSIPELEKCIDLYLEDQEAGIVD